MYAVRSCANIRLQFSPPNDDGLAPKRIDQNLNILNAPAESADRPLVGIAWMLATMFWFVTLDSTAKYLMQSYPVVQVIWARFFFHLVFVALLMGRQLPAQIRSQLPGNQYLRG